VVPNIAGLTIRHGVPAVHAHCGSELAGTGAGGGGMKLAGSYGSM
jgi:hypothetical protein